MLRSFTINIHTIKLSWQSVKALHNRNDLHMGARVCTGVTPIPTSYKLCYFIVCFDQCMRNYEPQCFGFIVFRCKFDHSSSSRFYYALWNSHDFRSCLPISYFLSKFIRCRRSKRKDNRVGLLSLCIWINHDFHYDSFRFMEGKREISAKLEATPTSGNCPTSPVISL